MVRVRLGLAPLNIITLGLVRLNIVTVTLGLAPLNIVTITLGLAPLNMVIVTLGFAPLNMVTVTLDLALLNMVTFTLSLAQKKVKTTHDLAPIKKIIFRQMFNIHNTVFTAFKEYLYLNLGGHHRGLRTARLDTFSRYQSLNNHLQMPVSVYRAIMYTDATCENR